MKKVSRLLSLVLVLIVVFLATQEIRRLAAEPADAALLQRKRAAETPKIDAAALKNLVQSFDQVEEQKHSWGWIRWLMNAQLDPQAKMTFGVVEIHAGQSNPAHVHPNCEEVLYVLSGSCEHMIGGRTVKLSAGDVIRIPEGVPHAARTSDKESMKAVIAYDSGNRQFVVVGEDGS